MLPTEYLVASCLVLLATASAAHASSQAGILIPKQPVDSQAALEAVATKYDEGSYGGYNHDSQKKEHLPHKFHGCAPGFGFDNGHCRPCRSGWYAPGGLTKCLPCGHKNTNKGFVTPKAAHSASQCLCAAGYGGFSCDECEAGSYSMGGNIGDREAARPPCQVCPANSKNSHEMGATSLLACGGCNPGYGGFNCDKCAPGTYSEGGDYEACKQCGPYQTSRPGSPSKDYCTCLPGYGLDSMGVCSICDMGTYWPGAPTHDPTSALIAAVAKSAQACIPCSTINGEGSGGFTTLTKGAMSAAQCVCKPGHAGPFCTACELGQICPGGTTAVAKVCPVNAYPTVGATDVSQCHCKPGYGASAIASKGSTTGPVCELCPAGTYGVGGTSDSCQPCPEGFTSPLGSDNKYSCVPLNGCSPGYGGKDCKRCPPGSFSPGFTFDECQTCGPYESSPAGSTGPEYCSCQAGYGANDVEGCSTCPLGFYSQGPPESLSAKQLKSSKGAFIKAIEPCTPCSGDSATNEGFTTLTVAATGTAQCVCKAGYAGPSCTPCKDNEICPGGNREAARVCPANSVKPAGGATHVSQCVCQPGSGASASGSTTGPVCELCPAGTYGVGGTSDSCKPCPEGFTSSLGSDNKYSCVPLNGCSPGYGGKDCKRCPPGSFSPGFTFDECQTCGPYESSPAGSTGPEYCSCQAGYGASIVEGCSTCPLGFYSQGPPESLSAKQLKPSKGAFIKAIEPCTPCSGDSSTNEGFTTLTVAATGTAQCVCKAGYAGPSCTPCKDNEICPGGNREAARVCPANSVKPAGGATHVSQCVCQPGSGASATGSRDSTTGPVCKLCPADTYGEGGSIDSCKPCPKGTDSPPGSKDKAACRRR